MGWAKIVSWHWIVEVLSDHALTRCGRTILLGGVSPLPDFPADEKTCESCLRLLKT